MMTSFKDVDIGWPGNKTDYLPGEKWFEQTYPASYRRYGAPIEIVWGANHDTVASCLREGATRLVHHGPEGRFYYWDKDRVAYCPVEPEERILAVVRSILRRASEGMTRSEKVVWFGVWNEKAIHGVLDAARALLSVDHAFFNGEGAHRRFVDGEFIEPTMVEGHKMFAREVVHQLPGSILTVSDAYQGYHRFCTVKKLQPLRRTTFVQEFRREAIEQFGVGLRHDLVLQQSGSKKTCQGWVDLGLGNPARTMSPAHPLNPLKSAAT